MIVLAVVGLFAARSSLPAYIEYFTVQKILTAMEAKRRAKGTVREIRTPSTGATPSTTSRRSTADDLEITKEGGEAVVTATGPTKVPLFANFSACLDFG